MPNSIAANCIVSYNSSAVVSKIQIEGKVYKTGVATCGAPTRPEYANADVCFTCLIDTSKDPTVGMEVHHPHHGKKTCTGFSA